MKNCALLFIKKLDAPNSDLYKLNFWEEYTPLFKGRIVVSMKKKTNCFNSVASIPLNISRFQPDESSLLSTNRAI